jgi:TP901 family phage tail tape measure protein|tara:strand:- start:1776 stop:3902 length:2127 start_codon:yes stop_codon:yes gene_type:complete
MANVGDLTVKLKADAKSLEDGLSGANKSLQDTSAKMKGVGKKMTMGATAPILGLGAGAIMTGANFEKGMNKVKALTGATGAEFDALSAQAKELGSSTMFSASQASEAMGFLAMAGFKTTDILGAMPNVLNLSAASGMELGDAADVVSNILTGFGKDTEDLAAVNDALVKAMTSSNVDLQMLGESMKYVGPVANAAGMDFNEVTAAVGLLGNAGIQGSMAGTSLRNAMTKLLTPTGEAQTTLAKLGVSALDSEGNLKSLTDIVGQLESSGMTTADAMTIFGQRAGPAMLALVSQGSGALDEMKTSLDNAGGTAQTIADVQMEGLSGATTEMKSALEGMAIALTEDILPVLTNLMDKITPIIQKFSSAPAPVKLVVAALLLLVAVVGPLLILISMMMPAIGLLGTAFGASGIGFAISTAATWAQTAAMAALNFAMGPIGLIIIGIAAAIAAGILIWKNWDKIVEVFKKTWDVVWGAIKSVFEPVMDAIKTAFDASLGWLKENGTFQKALNTIKSLWSTVWNAIKSLFNTVTGGIKTAFDTAFGWLMQGGALDTALTFLKDNWDKIWNGLKAALKIVVNPIIGFINAIINGLNSLFAVLNAIKLGWAEKKVLGVTVLPAFSLDPFNIAMLPTIPLLAKGGVVKSPTLAMLGEAGPEAVIPLSRRNGAGNGTTLVVNITGPTYGFDDFERKVSKAIRDGVRRGGFSGILQTG